MDKFKVYLYCLNGNTLVMDLVDDDIDNIILKIKGMLFDNEGGMAEVYGDRFYATVEV